MIICIAQAEPIIGGPAGWAGAGLLGLVLAWLTMKYIPDKDKQLKEKDELHDKAISNIIEKKSALIRDMVVSSQKAIDTITSTFKETSQANLDHCKEEMQIVANNFKETTQKYREDLHKIMEESRMDKEKILMIILKRQEEMANPKKTIQIKQHE